MSDQLANVVATLDDPYLDMYNHVIISMFTMCCLKRRSGINGEV
jgi:hypothetical protein